MDVLDLLLVIESKQSQPAPLNQDRHLTVQNGHPRKVDGCFTGPDHAQRSASQKYIGPISNGGTIPHDVDRTSGKYSYSAGVSVSSLGTIDGTAETVDARMASRLNLGSFLCALRDGLIAANQVSLISSWGHAKISFEETNECTDIRVSAAQRRVNNALPLH
jgi:hypothetical protein